MSALNFDPISRPHGAIGHRIHPRVEFPLEVEFDDGQRFPARNWGTGGFRLDDGALISEVGAAHVVRLIAPVLDSALHIVVNARVVRLLNGWAVGFQFVDLSPSQLELLDQLIQTGLDGDASVLGRLAAMPQQDLSISRFSSPHSSYAARNIGASVLLFCLIVAGGLFILSRLLTITADYAAVAADLRQLNAPEAGYLVSDALTVGARVNAGQTIAMVQPVPTPQVRLSTETQISVMEALLAQQLTALAETRVGFTKFLQTSRIAHEEATAARKLLDQQVAAGSRNFERLLTMQDKKIIADARVEQERQVFLGLQRLLSAARDTEEATRNRLSNAEVGMFPSDGRSTQKSPADIERSIANTSAGITRLRDILAALERPLPMTSPCDCRVASMASTPGTYVLAGARIADLAQEHQGKVLIDALIQNPRLTYIRLGQSVSVNIANAPEDLQGRVVAVNFNPANSGRIGLPDSVRTLADFGLVSIEVDRPRAETLSGTPATVVAPIDWWGLLANAPVMAWGRSLLKGSAAAAVQDAQR